jgi:hypothetical protein
VEQFRDRQEMALVEEIAQEAVKDRAKDPVAVPQKHNAKLIKLPRLSMTETMKVLEK